MKKKKLILHGQNMNTLLGSGMWPCGLCRSGVGNNSIFCFGCKHSVHKVHQNLWQISKGRKLQVVQRRLRSY